MGWSYGTNAAGREVGYAVDAECDHPDCHEEIDRGLAYCCGGMHDGGEHGCGGYFCSAHLAMTGPSCFMCDACCDVWDAANPNTETALLDGNGS